MVGVLPLLIGTVAGAFGIINFVPPLQRTFIYFTNRVIPNETLSPSDLVEAFYRGFISEKQYYDEMRKYGYDELKANLILNTAGRWLSVSDLLEAYRRGFIDEKTLDERLRKERFSDKDIEMIKKLMWYLPGVSDIIRFTVRDVYNEQVVSKYGYDEFFPSEEEIREVEEMSPEQRRNLTGTKRMIADALEVGIKPEVLRKYWRAHWELPSITQAIEMFHRLNPEYEEETPVSLEDFKTLLKINDYAPYWIDRFVKIIYALPTRVDIRRMLYDGIIDEEEAYKYYRKLGYDDEDAKRLVQLAKTFYAEEDRNLTRTLIEKAYIEGELNREEAIERLQDLGYSKDDAELIITLKEIDEREKIVKQQIDMLKDLYIQGNISEDELIKELNSLNLKDSYINRIVLEANIEKQRKQRYPSKEDLKLMLKRGIISKDKAKEIMQKLNYPDWLIQAYFKLWNIQ